MMKMSRICAPATGCKISIFQIKNLNITARETFNRNSSRNKSVTTPLINVNFFGMVYRNLENEKETFKMFKSIRC